MRCMKCRSTRAWVLLSLSRAGCEGARCSKLTTTAKATSQPVGRAEWGAHGGEDFAAAGEVVIEGKEADGDAQHLGPGDEVRAEGGAVWKMVASGPRDLIASTAWT
jgi:hypothetical protein